MIREAKATGCQAAVGGIGMLLWQGVAAFKLFTGKDMPAQEVLEKFLSYSYYQARAKGGFGLITIESTVEKDSELGGNFRIASYLTGKGQISEAIRSMIVRAKRAGVNIRLNTEATEEPLRALAPDAVILATGSVPLVLPIPGLAECGYVTAQDLLLGKTAAGRRALVVGGGMVGCEAAEYLAERGHQVAIVEMKDVIAADVTPLYVPELRGEPCAAAARRQGPRQCRSGHRRRSGGGAGHLRPTEPANYDVLCLGAQRKGVVQNGGKSQQKSGEAAAGGAAGRQWSLCPHYCFPRQGDRLS